ncbi:hypothetical protein BBJ28_00012469 [Nothophytophthora sp. Chile5]|nr:hypothetical protein BBJ28_00012469 [Nothophytophthora sp. Chile5]
MAGTLHADVLFLVTRYLQARGLFASALALQQESGVDCCWLRGGCRELALLRRWVFAGDVARVRAFLRPLRRLEAVQELTEVDRALQELQLLQNDEETDAARLAAAKLRCFERLVPLFRAPIDPQERDVFKYVAVSDLQLLRLLDDAVRFHRVGGNDTATDCVSVDCGARSDGQEEQEGLEMKRSSPLYLETPRTCSDERLLTEAGDLARSADWTRGRSHRQNPLALSMAVGGRQRREQDEEAEDEHVVENVEERMAETVDVGVGCASMEGCDAATQTEQPQETDSECGDEERDEAQIPAISGEEEEERQSVEPAVARADTDDNQRELEQGDHRESDPSAALVKAGPTSIAAKRESSPAAVVSEPLDAVHEDEQQLKMQALDLTGPPEAEDVAVEDQEEQEGEEGGSYCLADAEAVAPQRYDQLTLDHVVRAHVVAEAKEPQAIRALDVHPNGGKIVIGTNARALRVFDLSGALQQQRPFASSSSPAFLPLLPVALERHKHSASPIYCVAFNRHVTSSSTDAASMIASGAADGAIQLLTTRGNDGRKPPQVDELWLQRGDGGGVLGKTRALQFASPHLLWTATSGDRRLRCWDVRHASSSSSASSGVCQTLDGHAGEVQALTMPESAAPSSVLLSSALDKTIRLWDLRSSRCERLVASTKQSAFALRFHPTDETLVASGHQDGSVALWDLRSSSRRALQSVKPHEGECRAVSWTPEGRWLLSASFDGTLCLLQANAEASEAMLQPVASYHQHEGKVLQAQWLASARPAFVSTGADKRVKLWTFA